MQAAARRVTTRRSLAHSRRRCTADCPPTDCGSASLPNNGAESVTTTRTPLAGLSYTHTTLIRHTRALTRRRLLRRCARDESGDASASRQPVGVRVAPFGPVRRLSGSFGFVLLASLCCGSNPPIGAEKLSWLRRWQPRDCSTAAAAATPARRPCTAKHWRLLSLAAAQGSVGQRWGGRQEK